MSISQLSPVFVCPLNNDFRDFFPLYCHAGIVTVTAECQPRVFALESPPADHARMRHYRHVSCVPRKAFPSSILIVEPEYTVLLQRSSDIPSTILQPFP